MGALLFILLLFLGLLISTIGSIIGIVDAFRVSTLWGLLSFFIPFALLVFCIKFWNERKWARNALITMLGGLGMVLLSFLGGGLSVFNTVNSANDEFEDFTVEELPAEDGPVGGEPTAPGAEGEAVEVPAEGDDELFEEAMLPGLPTAAEIARAELLPSTDPNERIKEIDSERSNPYALVTIPPPPPPTPPAPPPTTTPPPGALPQPPAPNGNGGNNVQPPDGQGQPGGTDPTAPLPELPEPTVTASKVEISGIAAVDGESFVIVRAPGEPTSRYVRVGDRLSNGAVLVKRIENRTGSSPLVVLEERGEEIALPVGANVGAPEAEATTEASQQPSRATVATLPIPNLN